MTFHLLALSANVPTGTSAFTELAPIEDSAFYISGSNRFWSSFEARIFASYIGGNSARGARIYTSWKQPNQVRPISTTVLPGSTPPLGSWLDLPMLIAPSDEITMEAMHSHVSTQVMLGLLWLTTTGLEPSPSGELLTLRGDVSGASPGLRVWSEVTSNISWEYSLPPGRYGIIGSECVSPFGIAHRWILEGSNQRPGALSSIATGNLTHGYFSAGTLGIWGQFHAPVMPRLEVLVGNTPDSSHTIFLQIIRLP